MEREKNVQLIFIFSSFIRDFSNLEIIKIVDLNIDSMVGLSHIENEIFVTDGSDTLYVLDENFILIE